jgi:hypothetical protein
MEGDVLKPRNRSLNTFRWPVISGGSNRIYTTEMLMYNRWAEHYSNSDIGRMPERREVELGHSEV